MEAYLLDWANLLLRWLHVITAIAWIGSSFYFVWLDNNLIKPKSPDLLEKGVDGALWAVHGGGFYNPQKYMVAPKKIHTTLHWFYWRPTAPGCRASRCSSCSTCGTPAASSSTSPSMRGRRPAR